MSRHISRSLLRSSYALSRTYRAPQTRRFLSTAPPAQKSRSWKSTVARWSLAGGAIYYYNTSSLFAENPTLLEPLLPDSPTDETSLPTLESIAQARSASEPPPSTPSPKDPNQNPSPALDPSATESEASREGAFNEETGEINWDCPCLGGMAHGPCGDQFRQAFSCFVFSKEEPKGMDCIEHFKTMQGCFREHPDVYGGELEEDEVEEGVREQQAAGAGEEARVGEEPRMSLAEGVEKATSATSVTTEAERVQRRDAGEEEDQSEAAKTARAKEAKEQVQQDHKEPLSEADELVPKASHDARTANEGK